MKTTFSKAWISSKQPRKQRKYVAQAPLHIKGKFLSVHLSKDLRKNHKRRAIRVKKGDKVKVITGSFNGKTGTIESVNTSNQKVYITNVEYTKRDGSKARYPIHISNIMITELNLTDKKRKQKLEISDVNKPKDSQSKEAKKPAAPVVESKKPKEDQSKKIEDTKK